MPVEPAVLSFKNPVFQTYAIAASIMILLDAPTVDDGRE
jgi:hypothetical protein